MIDEINNALSTATQTDGKVPCMDCGTRVPLHHLTGRKLPNGVESELVCPDCDDE